MKKLISIFLCAVLAVLPVQATGSEYIKWVDFGVSYSALCDAYDFCLEMHESGIDVSFPRLIACVAASNGGDFKNYKKQDMEKIVERLQNGEDPDAIADNTKLYNYYCEAYEAVLGGMVGDYTEFTDDGLGNVTSEVKYGLKAYSPIAEGYWYNHYDDFGASRSFGYKRQHLGHDLMGSTETPIIAVEGGYVEACGWNIYGGWRVGIRSFDGKRYYYYAHLRKGHPYNDIYEGKEVCAGEVIGYLGMTGYSSTPDKNNINVPHLHYGLEIIFAPEQKDGWNQIWIDMYALTKFLEKNKAKTTVADNESRSLRWSVDANYPD